MRRLSAQPARAWRDVDGGSLVGTVIMFVIIGAIVSVLANSAIQSMRDAGDQKARVAGLPAADAGIAKFRQALDRGYASLADNYTLDANDLEQISGDASVIDMQAPQVPPEYRKVDSEGANASVPVPFTMVETMEGRSATGYWQIVRIIPPDYSTPDRSALVVYFRAWMSDSTGRSQRARTIRVGYRARPFSAYQMLSDEPIALERGARLSGPVHSNGYRRTAGGDSVMAPGDGSVRCDSRQRISTAQGGVAGLDDPCDVHGATGKRINFSHVGTALEQFQQTRDNAGGVAGRSCVAPVRCIGETALPVGGFYAVTMANDQVTWRACSASGSCGLPAGERIESATSAGQAGEALVFAGDVRLSGTVGGRLSIFARYPDDSGSAASIHLVGNTATRGTGTDVLGLVAQGDIVVDVAPGGACAVNRIDAALVAGSGGVTLPREYRSPVPPGATTPCTADLQVVGAIASREAPTLVWSWGAQKIGFTRRTYSFAPRLRHDIPPFFPLAGGWRSIGWNEANVDCLTTRWSDLACT